MKNIEEPKTPELKQMVEDIKTNNQAKTEQISNAEIQNTLKRQEEYSLNSEMQNSLHTTENSKKPYDFSDDKNKDGWWETNWWKVEMLIVSITVLLVILYQTD